MAKPIAVITGNSEPFVVRPDLINAEIGQRVAGNPVVAVNGFTPNRVGFNTRNCEYHLIVKKLNVLYR